MTISARGLLQPLMCRVYSVMDLDYTREKSTPLSADSNTEWSAARDTTSSS